jgi:hypothetical protein
MSSLPRLAWRAIAVGVLSLGTVAALTMAAVVGPDVASASATPPVCQRAGVTPAIVHSVFGGTATIGGGYDHPGAGRCPIESSLNGRPLSEPCDEEECLYTDVLFEPGHHLKVDVEDETEGLDDFGHAKITPFAGAGPGAALLTSTNYSGGATAPSVYLEAGGKTFMIAANTTIEGNTPRVFKQWEALARAIHARLS